MNLRSKIHITTAGLVLVVVTGMMSSLYISEKKQLIRGIQEEQKNDLNKLARVYEEARLESNDLIMLNYVNGLVASDLVEYAGVINEDGFGWIKPGPGKDPIFANDDPSVPEILTYSQLVRREELTADGINVIAMTLPIRAKNMTRFVRLGYSKKEVGRIIEARLKNIINKLTVVGFIAILFGLLLAHFISRSISTPILNLVKGAKSIAEGKKGVTVPEAGEDELGELTKTFNHMSSELLKLDHLKDDFMSHVTHELRSPLTSIIATVELMDEMPVASQNAKLRRSVDRLKYGSERLNKLVDNILDLTRLEAGKMQFDIQPINIATVACEMADFFEPRAMEKGLTMKAVVPGSFPMAKADIEKVRQVLSNLIHNAVKFTNEGGITIWVKEIKNVIHVGVQDTGVGIPKENLDSVFSKFQTLQDTKDRVNKPVPGSGLGLNIVQNSILQQGGKIWVESEIDKGSTFIFTLPTAEDQPKAKPKLIGEQQVARQPQYETHKTRPMVIMNPQDEAVKSVNG